MKRKRKIAKMPVVNSNAAGIDVGGKSHFVAIGQDAEDVKEFEAYTEDLHNLSNWLISNGIVTVAMESTGSYWQQLFTILKGERNAKKLAELADWRVKKSKKEIEKALTGNWREEYVFELQHAYEIYKNFHEKVAETDKKIEALLIKQTENIDFEIDKNKQPKKKRVNKNDPKVELEKFALKMTGGIDLMRIPAIGRNTLLVLMSEVGFDLSKFKTAKNFTAWLSLSPNNRISGGKILSSKTFKRKNRLSEALLRAANVIGNMKDNPLSEFFHRIAYRHGRMHAITATARKLGVIIWNMLTKKEQIRQHKVRKAQKLIKSAGISLKELKFATR